MNNQPSPGKTQNKNERSPIIICSTTKEYRFQTHAFVNHAECVLEIGSAHGVTCNQISNRCKNIVGIDIQQSLVTECKKKYPHIPFYCKDVLTIENYHNTILPNNQKKFTIIFIDIAGTIEIETLIPILSHIERVIRPKLIIVKSLNYSKLLIQLLKGYKMKVCNNKKLDVPFDDDDNNNNNVVVDAKLNQVDILGLTCRQYLEHECKIQHTHLKTIPCPFSRTWNGLKSSNERAQLCNMGDKVNFCRVIPSLIKSNQQMILVFVSSGIPYDSLLLDGVPVGSTIRRLKKGEIARNISRSMMETYRHLYICPPFMKNFPILICDQIITSAKNVDKFLYFELTLGEYIQVNIFNIINNKALNIVTNKMLLDQDKVINNQTSNVVNDGCSSVDSSSHSRLFLLLNISFVFGFVFMTCESKE